MVLASLLILPPLGQSIPYRYLSVNEMCQKMYVPNWLRPHYIRFLTDNPRTIHFVYFPKSSNPKTIAIFIRNFYNNIVAADTNTIYRLSIRLYDEEQKNKILKHIDGRYWYILDKIHFFRLNCIDILNII